MQKDIYGFKIELKCLVLQTAPLKKQLKNPHKNKQTKNPTNCAQEMENLA